MRGDDGLLAYGYSGQYHRTGVDHCVIFDHYGVILSDDVGCLRVGMGEDPHVFCKPNIIADSDPSLGINEDIAVEKGRITDLDILTKVESEIFLGDEPCAASLEEMFSDESPEKDRKVDKETYGELSILPMIFPSGSVTFGVF